jgi:pimeloyl-ACP methyl ester carboxylesterase
MAAHSLALRTLLALGGLLALGAGLAAWWLRSAGDRPPGFDWNRPALSEAAFATLGGRPGWRCVEVPASGPEGLRLRGLLRQPRDPAAPWLLFFQGNSLRLLGEGQEFLQAVAGERDLGLAVVAYRGYDGSPGRAGRDALAADAVATLRWLEAGPAAGAPVHLVAFSLGTLPALAAAAAGQEDPSLRRPESLTLLAPYTALRMNEPGRPWARFFGETFDARPYAARVRVPALVIHGGGDAALPPAMGRAIREQLGGPSRLLVLDQAGHLDLLTDPRALQAIRAALDGR